MDPSAKGNFLTFQTFVQLAAIVAAHHDGVFTSRNSKFGGAFAPGLCSIVQGTGIQFKPVPAHPGVTPVSKAKDYIELIAAVQPNELILPG
jgi:hypothetical protein